MTNDWNVEQLSTSSRLAGEVIVQQIGPGDNIAIKDKLCATGVMLKCNQQTIKRYQNLYEMEINACAETNDQIGQEMPKNRNIIVIILKVRD